MVNGFFLALTGWYMALGDWFSIQFCVCVYVYIYIYIYIYIYVYCVHTATRSLPPAVILQRVAGCLYTVCGKTGTIAVTVTGHTLLLLFTDSWHQ